MVLGVIFYQFHELTLFRLGPIHTEWGRM